MKNSDNQEESNVYNLVLDCQKLISANLLRITKDTSILFSIDWNIFCQSIRATLYAAKCVEIAEHMAYKITRERKAEAAGINIPLQSKYMLSDIDSFIDKSLSTEMKNTHQRMCQGLFLSLQNS